MNNQRKSTIINEIKYWKRNRLLPDHYCDYLLALYSEGTVTDDAVSSSSKPNRKPFKSLFGFSLPLLVPLTFLVIYFTELSSELQMLLFIFFIVIAVFGIFLFRQDSMFIHIPVIVTTLLILVASIHMAELLNVNTYFFTILIAFQALLWLAIGVWKKWYYLHVASILTILILVSFIILK